MKKAIKIVERHKNMPFLIYFGDMTRKSTSIEKNHTSARGGSSLTLCPRCGELVEENPLPLPTREKSINKSINGN